jgi:CRP/FNR family cyclic AMP-dependent transcriptional regulator
MHETKNLLTGHFLFNCLDEETIEGIARLFKERHAKRGETLFRKGDKCREMMLVTEGMVHIVANSPDGKEIIMNAIGPGGLIGELALLDGKPRSAQADVVKDCRMLVITRRDFMGLLRQKPDMTIQLMILLCQKLRDASSLIENIALNEIPVRLAQFLLKETKVDLAKIKANETFFLDHTQTKIGNFIGSGRERVNKVLHEWQNKAIISIAPDNRTVTILNPDAIKKIAANLS